MQRVVAVSLVFLLASCAPRREGIALDTDKTSAAALTTMTRQEDAKVRTLDGRGSISFESPEMSGSAAFTITVRKPDSLLVRLEGPFGIRVGLFFLSRDRFVMYNSMQNTVATGSPTSGTLRSVIPVDLTYEQIFDVFTGSIPLPDHEAPSQYTTDEGLFLLRYHASSLTSSYWLDPDELLVRRFQMTDPSGAVVLEGSSSGSIDQDGMRIARRLSLTMPREGRRVSVAFSRADINADDLSFDYTVPPSARRINPQ
ncbi:MAG TPA: DUF4292 domain-containing protein [Bacteroidota bacterium]|nr:DUF4292 domain-containing protein [Bacteroidota bacterium]